MLAPWNRPTTFVGDSNAVLSILPFLGVAVALTVAGHVWPEPFGQITTAAEGAAVALLGALVWRVVGGKTRLTMKKG